MDFQILKYGPQTGLKIASRMDKDKPILASCYRFRFKREYFCNLILSFYELLAVQLLKLEKMNCKYNLYIYIL